ncbi:hypothetical protein QRQ56_25730 [Bradyrhizobium sp. U531]
MTQGTANWSVVPFKDNYMPPVNELPFRSEVAILVGEAVKEGRLISFCKSGHHLRLPELEAMCWIYPAGLQSRSSNDEGRSCLHQLNEFRCGQPLCETLRVQNFVLVPQPLKWKLRNYLLGCIHLLLDFQFC